MYREWSTARLVSSIKHFQRLQELGLPTLSIIDVSVVLWYIASYKFTACFNTYGLDCSQFSTLATSVPTRGPSFKLFKPQLLQDIRSHAFSQQVINRWNKLTSNIVIAVSLSILKDYMISIIVTVIAISI